MRVLIAEDQTLLRAGLTRLFEDAGHDVVAAMGDASQLLDAVGELLPDLVVADVRMPPSFTDEGALAARAVKNAHPGVGVLVLSQQVETTHAADLVGRGGFGYLLKDRVLDVEDFLDAARRVADGGSALDPQVVATLLRPRLPDSPLATLSQRESDVLALMAQGLTNTAIAGRLVVSERTVEGHVRHLLIKLGVTEDADGHRRVRAVLAWLRASGAN